MDAPRLFAVEMFEYNVEKKQVISSLL